MPNKLKTFLALSSLLYLCGCFHLEVYHHLERYGDSDRGGFRFSMDDAAYVMLAASDEYETFMSRLSRFSNPNVRSSGGTTYIEDLSGRASIEHMYDNFSCRPDPNSRRHVICDFSTDETDLDFMGWYIDWTIDLDPDMQMLSSNHHRTRVEDGRRQYIWDFDGNRVSAYNIRFRVRVLRS